MAELQCQTSKNLFVCEVSNKFVWLNRDNVIQWKCLIIFADSLFRRNVGKSPCGRKKKILSECCPNKFLFIKENSWRHSWKKFTWNYWNCLKYVSLHMYVLYIAIKLLKTNLSFYIVSFILFLYWIIPRVKY